MSELRFDSENNNLFNQNVEETDKYTSIINLNKYEFLTHSYYGSGGYRDGSYLIPHTREMFLRHRKELSAYRNFLKPILDSLITPVFSQESIRIVQDTNGNEINGDTLYGTFIEDVNKNGDDIQCFTEQAVTYARLHGVCFIVMDNYNVLDIPKTVNESITNRIMPYVYLRMANSVETYTIDHYGNLQSITFEEQPVEVDGKLEKRYRVWTTAYSQVLKKDKNDKFIEAEPLVFHGLGELPVISLYSIKKKCINDILVDPPLYDIARLNHLLYNKDSCILDQERAQAFSNFYIQGDNNGNVTLGPHNVIFVPMDATMSPGFASPDSSILAGLVANADKLKDSIFQIAQQNGVYGIQEAKSGLAMSYDFYAQEYQLHKTASMATFCEQSIADLFKLYTNTDFEYVVEYPDEYQPGNSKAIIDTYKVVLDMGVPDKFKNAIFEKMANLLFSEDDETKLKEIIDDINKEEVDGDSTETREIGEVGDSDPDEERSNDRM